MSKTDPYIFKNIKGLLHACQDLTPEIYFSDEEEGQNGINMDEIAYIVGNIAYYQKQHGEVNEIWQHVIKNALTPILKESFFRYITDQLKKENYSFLKSVCSEVLDFIEYAEKDTTDKESISVGDIKKAQFCQSPNRQN